MRADSARWLRRVAAGLGASLVCVAVAGHGATDPAPDARGSARAAAPGAAYLPAAVTGRGAASTATPGPDATATAAWSAQEGVFGLARVHDIALEVSDAGVASLLAEPRAYVRATVRIDDASFAPVGVRLKGGAGSFVPLDGDYPPVSGDGNGRPGKSAFIVRFDAYTPGLRYGDLEKLTLNNLVQDPSSVHEFLGYALFRAGGVAAGRVGYASVAFNGQEKGLYAVVETPDNAAFLERWFGSAGGGLYEGEYGVDLRREQVDAFDRDRGSDRSRDDLRDLVDALDAIAGPDEVVPTLERHLDLEAYLTFAATELYLGHWDGYCTGANNYRIYRRPADGRWTFLPWGIDQVFVESLGPYAGVMREPGPSWGGPDAPGRVHGLCLSSDACRQRLHAAFRAVIARVEAMGLVDAADRAFGLVAAPTRAEAEAFGDPLLAVAAREQVYEFLGRRPAELEAWLPCLAGEAVDRDRDGFDGCVRDCDDGHPAVHPGAAERCNFRDDDCNGRIDDAPGCPRCVPVTGPGGARFGLCFDPMRWDEARALCVREGGDLASLHDRETADHLAHLFAERLGVGSSWIGLNDRAAEGRFVWSDGTPLDFAHWAMGAPDPQGQERDCVAARPYGWRDVPCEAEMPALCRLGGGSGIMVGPAAPFWMP